MNQKGSVGFTGVIEQEDGTRGRIAQRAQRPGGWERSHWLHPVAKAGSFEGQHTNKLKDT